MPDPAASSPYEVVLGERMQQLHPRLRAYFQAIPPGCHGWGAGVFETAGSPRSWLWPFLWMLQGQGILFAGWQRDVPFTVVNQPVVGPAIRAARRFELAGGTWVMVDEIGLDEHGHLSDRLGRSGLIEAAFQADVVDGALQLRSTRVALRLGRLRLGIPGFLAPRVLLTERWDERHDRQHMRLTMTAPLLGTLYEYGGSFRYEIRQGEERL